MAVYYVKEQGALIKKLDKRILVEKNGHELADIPLHMITNMSVFGNVQVTTQALHLLMEAGIDVSFFSYSGAYIGQIAAGSSKNVFLRFAQYERYQDLGARLKLARRIVGNKIDNQIAVIKSYSRQDIDYDYTDDITQMEKLKNMLPDKNTSNEIMGVEGSCSAVYFGVYGHMFKCRVTFDRRNRRPPKDPINVILSLAYTLLTKEVVAALESESFETYLGFLHGIRYGRKSLSLDIVEEFRQPVVDRLTLILFNKQMLSEFDFDQGEDRIVLSEDGFKKFCREYEQWMKRPAHSNDNRSFRSIISYQIGELKKAIRDSTDYEPYSWSNVINKTEADDVSDSI